MRILFTIPHLKISGGTRIILTYADRLARRGHDVSVLVEEQSGRKRFLGDVLGMDIPRWIRPDFKPRIIRVPRIDSYALPHVDVAVASRPQYAQALAASGIPFVHLIQHDDGLYHEPRDVADAAYRLPCRKIAVSTWVADVIQERNPAAVIDVLLNPIDREQFTFIPAARRSSTVRVLMLDHPYAWKGTKEGAEAVTAVKTRHPELQLVLFSARRNTPSVDCDEFHSNPSQGSLAALYSSCHIYLCPSWDEGSGLPSMEALLCECTLVTYDNGGSRDFAVDGETALVAARGDRDALIERLERGVTDATLRAQLGAAGKKRILALPTWEAQTEQFERILADVCR